MELNAATDYLGTNELLCDITAEQPVEGEFTIPDYQPEIFKIVKAKAEPVVVQKLAVGSRATVDGYVRLTVIYQSNDDKRLFASTQKLPYSKQIDLKDSVGDNCTIMCDAGISYLNCRAVNQRRIDVRGAANLEIKVLSGKATEVVSDVSGDGAQQRQREVEFMRQTGIDEKQFTLDEPLSVDFDGCEAPAILRCDAKALKETVSVEDGRIVVSGAVNVSVALDVSTEDEYRVKRAAFSLPFNQVAEADGMSEDNFPIVSVSVLSASAEVEEANVVGASVLCALDVRTFENGSATLVNDAFSTRYELDITAENVSVIRNIEEVSQPIAVRQTIEKPAPGAKLIDYYVSPVGASFVSESGAVSVRLSSMLSYFLSDAAGDIVSWDQPFEFDVDVEQPFGKPYYDLDALFTGVECSEAEDTITFKAEGTLYGSVIDIVKQPAVISVSADTSKPKTRPDMALSIYYADEGEDIFEIAKTFNTSPIEIAQENNITDGILEQKSMLLIPIVE